MLIEGYYVMNHVVYYGCFDDEDNLVFYKIKRTPVAISLKSRRLITRRFLKNTEKNFRVIFN